MAKNNPIVIVPGLLGSALENTYSVQPESTWSELGAVDVALGALGFPKVFSLALDRSGSFDASPQVVTTPNGLISSAYERLAASLRSRRAAPVYLFAFDWRLSTATTGRELANFVKLVRAKMASSQSAWSGKIDFVVHSLGGLVFRSFLGVDNEAAQHVGQVVFLAVPHQGTLEAAEAMIRGKFFGNKELRKLARTFPSLYELLPTFSRAIVSSEGTELSPFELGNWQKNVTPIGDDGAELNGFDVVQAHLDAARKQQAAWRNPTDVLAKADMLTIYGSNPDSTLRHVRVLPPEPRRPNNWYDFDGAIRGNGDGVVPVESALLPGVASILLSKDLASPLAEMKARFVDFHAFIATLDETQTITNRFLDGERAPEQLLPHSCGLDRYHVPA